MDRIMESLSGLPIDFANVYIALLRIITPVLMLLILYRAGKPLLSFRKEPEIWALLRLPDGSALPVTHWENIIGSHKSSDLVLELPTISRNHAVLTRYDDGSWTITDAESKNGVRVNGRKVDICALESGDVIELGGLNVTLEPITPEQEERIARMRTKASSGLTSIVNALLLTLLQALCCLGFLVNGSAEHASDILLGFGGICAAQWAVLIFYACIRRSAFEVETIAFFLCTMGMNVIAATVPGEVVKQLIAMGLGLALFFAVGWSLRDLERAKVIRYGATAAGILFLVITLLFGKEIYGAKNWLVIGGFSLQPSELSKLCFVYVGASTMDRIMKKRNLIGFIAYSVVLCGLLALMNDFGTALIFFVAFLAIAYMRSGSVGTIGLACTSLGFAGVIALKIAPHALRRFTIWRNIWEDPLGRGYQQTRSLMCMASGGLLGLGAGNGWMKNLFASDTDVVFATVTEEWGLITAMAMVAGIVILAAFCLRSASLGRSSFYTIGACTAASILLAQTILNVMGTIDLLPFTGVTFPFVSNGGSSMLSAWGLMAFVKAADTRLDASFAIRRTTKKNREVTE
ncbi:MAG: FtsW/RodA/SpoVE family cell cycle protein [Oscillospiraceae bacterium]|nr:FtsW/RodA/SpoVE family cell cycle protein [Oscillospiraceae bacterium]